MKSAERSVLVAVPQPQALRVGGAGVRLQESGHRGAGAGAAGRRRGGALAAARLRRAEVGGARASRGSAAGQLGGQALPGQSCCDQCGIVSLELCYLLGSCVLLFRTSFCILISIVDYYFLFFSDGEESEDFWGDFNDGY
jgi:hypothetical protein